MAKAVGDAQNAMDQAALGAPAPNVAMVAYANKLARIAWAIMMHGNRYNPALAFTTIS